MKINNNQNITLYYYLLLIIYCQNYNSTVQACLIPSKLRILIYFKNARAPVQCEVVSKVMCNHHLDSRIKERAYKLVSKC